MRAVSRHTDEELLGLLKRGDKRAFEEIYRENAPDLFRYARRNVSNKEDCEEIIQEVFESIWARRKNLEVLSFRFYLIKMVKYKLVRYFQKKSQRKRMTEHFGIFESIYDYLDLATLDEEVIQKAIENRIAQLPDRCQVAFRLRLYEWLSNGDIAKRMNITKGTVENYMNTALNHMRASIPNPE